MLFIPGMVENLVAGKVHQYIPGVTSEPQPMACRESGAYYVAPVVVKKRYLVPVQKSVGGSASHTYNITSIHLVLSSRVIYIGSALFAGKLAFFLY